MNTLHRSFHILLLALAVFILLPCTVHAANSEPEANCVESSTQYSQPIEAQFESSGAYSLTDEIPDNARKILGDIKPSVSPNFSGALKKIVASVVGHTGSYLREGIGEAVKLLSIALLCGIAREFTSQTSTGFSVTAVCGTAAAAAVTLGGTSTLISEARALLSTLSGFSKCLLPVLTTAAVACGAPTAATTHYAAVVFLCDVVITALDGFIVTCALSTLALQLGMAVSGNPMPGKLADMINWIASTSLKTILTLFLTYLTLNGILSGNTDALALKGMKLAMSTALPVIGSVMSDAAEAVLTGAKLVRNVTGAFGAVILAAAAVLPLLRLGIRALCFRFAAAAVSLCQIPALERVAQALSDTCYLLFGLCGTATLLLLISSASIILIGGV